MSSLSADVRCSALSSAKMHFPCAERSSGQMSARYELAALSQDGIHFNVVLISGPSSAPSSQARESAQCSQLPNSQTSNRPPWAENHDFLEKATITWLASSNWSVAHLALSAAIFFKLARHSRRQGSLRRSRRRPGPTALRGPWRLLRIGAFACLRASEAKPLKAMVCTSLRQESRGVSAVNSAAFWL